MTNIDERDAYEKAVDHLKWLKDTAVDKQDLARVVGYEDCLNEWKQARAALPTAGNNHIAVIRKMVDRQAEDEGLWFIAKYASEAYLQKALRKLHAVIESVPPEPTAEVSEDEVVEIMAKGMEPTYSDTYSSRELIEKAIRALSNNGYKVVRKS
jgi:hypothetical protein